MTQKTAGQKEGAGLLERVCRANVADGGQNLCTRSRGHDKLNGEDADGHRCKAVDVDQRIAARKVVGSNG